MQVTESLYGLKQTPCAWFKRLHDFLVLIGFKASKVDASLFIYSTTTTHIYLLVYVDNILIMGSDKDLVSTVLDKLTQAFKIRDIGTLTFLLGIEIVHSKVALILSQ